MAVSFALEENGERNKEDGLCGREVFTVKFQAKEEVRDRTSLNDPFLDQ